MNEDRILPRKWIEFQLEAWNEIPEDRHEYFDIQKTETDVNQIVSGYDFRTFPREGAWKSEGKFLWKRQGLFVFDFRGRRGLIPEGIVTLRKSKYRMLIKLKCRVIHANLNMRDVIDEGIAEGFSERHFSKVCGRSTLQLLEFSIGPNERKRVPIEKKPQTFKAHRLERPLPRIIL